jgi:alpha-tubulin suppressor-like RCC1 family protein
MSISLPTIFSITDENKNIYLSILVQLTLLPIDILFMIFKVSKLGTILSFRDLCSYFIDVFGKSTTLKFLQRKAQKETRFNTDNFSLENLIRLSQLRTSPDIFFQKESLFVIKNNSKIYEYSHLRDKFQLQRQVSPNNFKQIYKYHDDLLGLDNMGYIHIIDSLGHSVIINSFETIKFCCSGVGILALTKSGKIMNIIFDRFQPGKFDIEEFKAPVSKIVDICSGHFHLLLLDADGRIHILETNTGGCSEINEFISISRPCDVIQISSGSLHSLALTKDGLVYSFGNNQFGQLGLEYLSYAETPTLIPGLDDVNHIASGCNHSLALKNNGKLYVFGDKTHNQLEVSSNSNIKIPLVIHNVTNVERIWSRLSKTIIIMKNGDLLVLKNNKFQLVCSINY